MCLGRVSPLAPGVTAFQRPQAFRKLVTSLYVYRVSLRGLVRILDLLGCGVGAATLWRDVQAVAPGRMPDPQAALSPWLEVDETWLSIGGAKRPVAVVLGPTGERLDLRLSGPGFDGGDGFTDLAQRGARILTTDDAPVYGPALDASGLDRQQCAVPSITVVNQLAAHAAGSGSTGPSRRGGASRPARPASGAGRG